MKLLKRTRRCKKTGKVIKSSRWYLRFKDIDGKVKKVRLCADKTMAEREARKILHRVDEGQLGHNSAQHKLRLQPLTVHVKDFEQHLRTKGKRGSDDHINRTVGRVQKVIDGCGFTLPIDIQADAVQTFLAGLRYKRRKKGDDVAVEAGKTVSVQTRNYYARELKTFVRWMVRTKRLAVNPLDELEPGDADADRRHLHRTLPETEILALLTAARSSDATFRRLNGEQRHWLYQTALATGFRAHELSCLRPEDFLLTMLPPRVQLAGEFTKNKRPASQPINPALVDGIQAFLAGLPVGNPVWPGSWWTDGAEMVRLDAAAAGIPLQVVTTNGPEFTDMHSLRHCFVASLDRAGLTLKQAMTLARHSDPRLTAKTYGRATMEELGAAVRRVAVHQTPNLTHNLTMTIDARIGQSGLIETTAHDSSAIQQSPEVIEPQRNKAI